MKALGDVRVRQAIVKAINRQQLVEAQYGAISKGNVAPHEGLCSKEQLGCGYTKDVPGYDPAGAKKLMAEAGYADGFDVVISTFPTNQTESTALSGMLRAIGIRAAKDEIDTAAVVTSRFDERGHEARVAGKSRVVAAQAEHTTR